MSCLEETEEVGTKVCEHLFCTKGPAGWVHGFPGWRGGESGKTCDLSAPPQLSPLGIGGQRFCMPSCSLCLKHLQEPGCCAVVP